MDREYRGILTKIVDSDAGYFDLVVRELMVEFGWTRWFVQEDAAVVGDPIESLAVDGEGDFKWLMSRPAEELPVLVTGFRRPIDDQLGAHEIASFAADLQRFQFARAFLIATCGIGAKDVQFLESLQPSVEIMTGHFLAFALRCENIVDATGQRIRV